MLQMQAQDPKKKTLDLAFTIQLNKLAANLETNNLKVVLQQTHQHH